MAWVQRVAARSRLVNSAAVVGWGLDKVYQQALEAVGVAVVPTVWVEPGASWEPPSYDFVIKPTVSGGGRSTARYSAGETTEALAHLGRLHRAGQTAMVQPYIAPVDEVGEIDVVFIAGHYSHAVGKEPLLRAGDGLVERPWEKVAWTGLATPAADQLAAATETIRAVGRLVGETPTYARVDLIRRADGNPLVLECELVDPYLSLDLVPEAAAQLARAVMSRNKPDPG